MVHTPHRRHVDPSVPLSVCGSELQSNVTLELPERYTQVTSTDGDQRISTTILSATADPELHGGSSFSFSLYLAKDCG